MLTIEQLKMIMPHARDRANVYLIPLNDAMAEFGIDTPLRVAAFLSQVAHESGSLRYTHELASGIAYEGRVDLGNVQSGDGMRFRGRGPIQITGRNNYRACSIDLYGDERLLDTPELLENVIDGCRASAWFWKTNGVNKWADLGDIDGVSDVINRGRKTAKVGDANGYPERIAFYQTAREVLS